MIPFRNVGAEAKLVKPGLASSPPTHSGKPPLQVNVSRWSQLFRKLGVVKGDDIVSEVHRQIFPVIVVEDDRPEHKLLAGERLAWGQFLKAAVVGQTGYVGLRNPTGSGIILVVEQVAAMYAARIFRFYLGLLRAEADWTQASSEQPRDTRLQAGATFGISAPNITGQIVHGDSSVISAPFVVWEFAAGVLNTLVAGTNAGPLPVAVLAPGDTLAVFASDGAGGTVANLAIQASFAWRERATEPGETA